MIEIVGLSYIDRMRTAQQQGFDPCLTPPRDVIDFVAERIRRRGAEPMDDGDDAA